MVTSPKGSEMPEYRLAVSTDAAGILAVLEEVAPKFHCNLPPRRARSYVAESGNAAALSNHA